MKVVIETISRGVGPGAEYLALATAEGAKLETSSLGFGASAEGAAHAALTAFCAERKAAMKEAEVRAGGFAPIDAQPSEYTGLRLASDAEVEQERKSLRPLTRKVAVGKPEIRKLLERAIAAGTWVKISGEKVSGERYTERIIRPMSLRPDAHRFLTDPTDYSLFCAVEGGDSRTFKLSGIQRAEDV